MGTITAQIIVGTGHPNHDGICPTHRLYLTENSRPAWVMVSDFPGSLEVTKVTWIPTLENMLEDALLMIAIHIIQDPEIVAVARRSIQSQENNWVVMYEDLEASARQELYRLSRNLENTFKLVVTVLRGSAVLDQLKVLDMYKMDLEICTPSYIRLYSRWLEQTRVEGEF